MLTRFKHRIQRWFTTPNNSLIVSAITTSPGRTSSGNLEYFVLNQLMQLFVTVHKNKWKTASWTVRQSYDISTGTGNIIASGKIKRETIDQNIVVDYTPNKQQPIQFEIEVISGSTLIRKFRVITVRSIPFSAKEQLEIDNIINLINNIRTDVKNGIRTKQHVMDLDTTIKVVDSIIRVAELEEKEAQGFVKLRKAFLTLKADFETEIKKLNDIQRN